MSQKPLRLEYKNVYFYVYFMYILCIFSSIPELNIPLEENCFYTYLTLHYTITHYFYQTFLAMDLIRQKHMNYTWARLQNAYYWVHIGYERLMPFNRSDPNALSLFSRRGSLALGSTGTSQPRRLSSERPARRLRALMFRTLRSFCPDIYLFLTKVSTAFGISIEYLVQNMDTFVHLEMLTKWIIFQYFLETGIRSIFFFCQNSSHELLLLDSIKVTKNMLLNRINCQLTEDYLIILYNKIF